MNAPRQPPRLVDRRDSGGMLHHSAATPHASALPDAPAARNTADPAAAWHARSDAIRATHLPGSAVTALLYDHETIRHLLAAAPRYRPQGGRTLRHDDGMTYGLIYGPPDPRDDRGPLAPDRWIAAVQDRVARRAQLPPDWTRLVAAWSDDPRVHADLRSPPPCSPILDGGITLPGLPAPAVTRTLVELDGGRRRAKADPDGYPVDYTLRFATAVIARNAGCGDRAAWSPLATAAQGEAERLAAQLDSFRTEPIYQKSGWRCSWDGHPAASAWHPETATWLAGALLQAEPAAIVERHAREIPLGTPAGDALLALARGHLRLNWTPV
jgi:hypothetical protein